MPKFHYKARSMRGEPLEGFIDAANSDAVASQLFNTGVTPIEISESKEQQGVVAALSRYLALNEPTLDNIIMFSRQMYTLQRAGVPVIKGITGIAQSTRNLRLQEVLYDVADHLDAGRDMAGSLSRHPKIFSPLYISIIQIGENSGALDESFLCIYEYLMREKDTRDRIKNATRYPIIVVVAILIAMIIANVFIIPVFAQMYAKMGADLPLVTQVLIGSSNFTVEHWPILLGTMVGVVFLVLNYVKTETGRFRWHRWKLRIPVIGPVLLRASLARFARSFSITLRTGVPLIQGLTLVSRAIGNEYLGERILMMRNGVEQGESLTRTAIATNLFTPLIIQMLAVGEESGTVDEMLNEVADYYDREVDYDLKYLSDALQPILITIMGVFVLVLALGLFLPMWDMYGHMLGG